jgi:hypothetical protein
VLAFTREAMVNDDVGFFTRMGTFFGNAAAALEGDVVYGILTGKPPMADGQPLFSAAHGNLMPAATINIQSVAAARQAMLNQKSPDGLLLALMPRFLIVGPLQEVYALQFLAPITIVGATQDVIPSAYQSIQLVVEPRITDAAWYLAASPGRHDRIRLSGGRAERRADPGNARGLGYRRPGVQGARGIHGDTDRLARAGEESRRAAARALRQGGFSMEWLSDRQLDTFTTSCAGPAAPRADPRFSTRSMRW